MYRLVSCVLVASAACTTEQNLGETGDASASREDGDASPSGVPDGGTFVVSHPDEPSDWALWRMTHTNASEEDSGKGYLASTTGLSVLDQTTKLIWQRAAAQTLMTFADAKAYCETLVLDGETEWRLPSRIELISLMTDSRNEGLPYAFDLYETSKRYRSATSASGGGHWGASFFHGDDIRDRIAVDSDDLKRPVRCVLGSAPPPSASPFVKEADSVRDRNTGLIWRAELLDGRADANSSLSPEGACRAILREGRGGYFSAPTIKELATLVDTNSSPPWSATFGPIPSSPLLSNQFGSLIPSTGQLAIAYPSKIMCVHRPEE